MNTTKALMLIVAVILDMLGVFCIFLDFFQVGNVLSGILDWVGLLLFGMWRFFKGRTISGRIIEKWSGLIVAFIAEIIPIFGDIWPSWTIYVLSTKD